MALRAQDAPTRRELQPGDPVDLYLRMSRDPGHDELGVQRQRRECEALAARRGWRVAMVHTDDDRSAYSGKPRPGYLDLMARVEAGAVRGLVAWHPDRLHRSPKELEAFIETIEAAGASVVTARAGDLDLSTPAGRMQARIAGVIARHESEHKSERILAKMEQLRRDGRFTGGGRRPYGYEKREAKSQVQVLRPDEAAIVREAARRALTGESMLSIVRDLKARGVRSATGGQWTLTSMSTMLRSARIAGLRDDGHGALVAAPWPAIIGEREHRELVALLSTNARSGQHAVRSFLLTGGLIRCHCGAAMVGRPYGTKNAPTYSCVKDRGGCNRCFVRAAPVDELVAEAVFAVLDGPGLADRVRAVEAPQDDLALAAVQRQEERIRDIETDYASGELERGEYRRLRDGARTRLAELQAQVQPRRTSVLDEFRDTPLRAAWPTLPLGKRRAVLEAVIEAVIIAPKGKATGARFDDKRMRILWRA